MNQHEHEPFGGQTDTPTVKRVKLMTRLIKHSLDNLKELNEKEKAADAREAVARCFRDATKIYDEQLQLLSLVSLNSHNVNLHRNCSDVHEKCKQELTKFESYGDDFILGGPGGGLSVDGNFIDVEPILSLYKKLEKYLEMFFNRPLIFDKLYYQLLMMDFGMNDCNQDEPIDDDDSDSDSDDYDDDLSVVW